MLDNADILVVNLECDITTSTDREDKHYTFKAPPITADALGLAGVGVAGVANNHAMDWGEQGLLDTIGYMKDRGIATPGGGKNRAEAYAPVLITRNGLTVAFLAYTDAFTESTGFNTKEWQATRDTPGLAIARPKRIAADVAKAKTQADVVVVLVHAGYEYVPTHNSEQRAYAERRAGRRRHALPGRPPARPPGLQEAGRQAHRLEPGQLRVRWHGRRQRVHDPGRGYQQGRRAAGEVAPGPARQRLPDPPVAG